MNNTKKLFQTYICEILSNIYGKLEWEPLPNEGSQAAMLRGLILIQMGINGHNKTRDEAHKLFEKLLNDNDHQSMNPNIRAAIYLTVAKTGNQQTFEQLQSVITEVSKGINKSLYFSCIVKLIHKKKVSVY
jgi:hypothetical protein